MCIIVRQWTCSNINGSLQNTTSEIHWMAMYITYTTAFSHMKLEVEVQEINSYLKY